MHFWQGYRVKEMRSIPLFTVLSGVKLHISLKFLCVLIIFLCLTLVYSMLILKVPLCYNMWPKLINTCVFGSKDLQNPYFLFSDETIVIYVMN